MKDNYLFSPKDINTLVEDAAADVLKSDLIEGNIEESYSWYHGTARNFTIELNKLIDKKTMHIDFMTAGNLSLHNIIELMINRFGKCNNLYISTWAIKEAAARSILAIHNKGLIAKMYGVFDYRIKSVDLKSFQLIEPYFNKYELTKNHAKVILMPYGV